MIMSSNLEVILPEKHSNDQLDPKFHDQQEFQLDSTQEDHELRPKLQLVQEKQHDVTAVLPAVSLGLKIKIPSYKDEKDDSNEGFKTPTSSEHKIPMILPPPPRKPKLRPPAKRKGCCRPQIVHDLSQEIESFFSTTFAVNIGHENKKVKLFTNS